MCFSLKDSSLFLLLHINKNMKMEKKLDEKEKDKVETVIEILRKEGPYSAKQEKYCNRACVERFLKAKGDNVKKASKQLRNCLAWRESIGTDNLIADEFSGELAEGLAYVAGHDDESRPVVIFRMKQDYHKFHSQKLYIRLAVFTLEVAIQSMARNVEQFVILFDASFFRSASAFINLLLATLKMIAEYYPGRLHKVFIIDSPSLFSYLWKGVRPFVELSTLTVMVSSLDFEESLEFNDFTSYRPRAASLRFNSSSVPSTSTSSRFSFTVSPHLDSLKPWYLTLTNTSSSQIGLSARISPINARSFSFASPVVRTLPEKINTIRTGFFPSTPIPENTRIFDYSSIKNPRTPRPSVLQSPSLFFKDHHIIRREKSKESFFQFLRFYRRPYNEMIYRSKMKPPLGGLVSIVSPQFKHRHMSM